MYSQIQSFLMPFSFGLLLLLMLVYWTQATFFSQLKYKKITNFVLGLAISSLTVLLVFRWLESGHFPLSNLYESLVFLSWSFLLSHVLLQTLSANELVGVVTSPMALFTYGFASFSLPKEMQQSTSLVPALQSNWLMMHVSIMVLSYAALLCGSLLSMAFLVFTSDHLWWTEQPSEEQLQRITFGEPYTNPSDLRSRDIKLSSESNTNSPTEFAKCTSSTLQSFSPLRPGGNMKSAPLSFTDTEDNQITTFYKEPIYSVEGKINIASTLDNLSYRLLGLGFPLLTVGILSGAVWANEAWGSYWSWDPKETWAFITWLVFAMYLHARITKGWVGKKPALIATIGFFVVWFCYLGVNLLGTGLHSYGWFSN